MCGTAYICVTRAGIPRTSITLIAFGLNWSLFDFSDSKHLVGCWLSWVHGPRKLQMLMSLFSVGTFCHEIEVWKLISSAALTVTKVYVYRTFHWHLPTGTFAVHVVNIKPVDQRTLILTDDECPVIFLECLAPTCTKHLYQVRLTFDLSLRLTCEFNATYNLNLT